MLVGDNYKITSDKLCVILHRKYYRTSKAKNPGKEYWEVVGYYKNVKCALKDFVQIELMSTMFESFEVLLNKIKELEKIIEGLEV